MPTRLRIAAPSHNRSSLNNCDMLCFSHDWSGDPLSKTHLMRIFARDHRILWVNSIGYRAPNFASKKDLGRLFSKLKKFTEPVREVEPNIFVLNPVVAPPYDNRLVNVVNRVLLRRQVRSAMSKLNFLDPINWVFNPAAATVAGALGESLVVYYCVDEYTAFTGVATDRLERLEAGLLDRANLVVVSAERLLENKKRRNPNVLLVRHGVDVEHFATAVDFRTVVPEEIRDLPKPIIGFIGLVADWVDVDAMVRTAKAFPNGSLVVIGGVTTDVSSLAAMPNVHFLGRKPYADLPAYCKNFDVAINPFIINELTLNANPLKVREYLAAGLPVVSTAIPEVEALDACLIARTPDEFVSQVRLALLKPGPDGERSQTMASESWESRVEILKDAIAAIRPTKDNSKSP
jgi:glycosyltransferase involved in cell wall biosynthesis